MYVQVLCTYRYWLAKSTKAFRKCAVVRVYRDICRKPAARSLSPIALVACGRYAPQGPLMRVHSFILPKSMYTTSKGLTCTPQPTQRLGSLLFLFYLLSFTLFIYLFLWFVGSYSRAKCGYENHHHR